MNKLISTSILMIVILFGKMNTISALDVITHKAINENIAQNKLNGFSLDLYLINQLGINNGVKEKFNSSMTWELLRDGGEFEDIPVWYMIYRRSVNHFHNPLRPLVDAGFTGVWGTYILSGQSAILWSQNQLGMQDPGGFYSWYDVRNYFYSGLTAYDKKTRDTNFAETFRGLGQLMHLVQDMSVPEHARDDGHYSDAYEEWVKSKPDLIKTLMQNPVYFDSFALAQPTAFGAEASVPIANLFDTNQYGGTNPNPQVTTQYFTIVSTPTGPIGVDKIGLSEYTNANFLSLDTMFTDNLPPASSKYFPYPKRANAALWNDTMNNRYYFKKTGDGEPINHLAHCGLICMSMLYSGPQFSDNSLRW